MERARWEQMQAVFHEAADLPPAEQRAYVERVCAGDVDLATGVLALLEEDARHESLLDRGVEQMAQEMFGAAGATADADADGEAIPLPFRQIGRYTVLRRLGEGGMGVVYLAKRPDLGSLVAIKILRDAALSPARRERFASEQRTLAQLTHRSIARLYDADVLPDGTPWFAMEYVEGTALDAYLREHAGAGAAGAAAAGAAAADTLEERLRLFRDICEAVQYAHQRLVIHRDLKPSNILVTPEGAPKLLDFGIAKQLDPPDAPIDQARTTFRLLTPMYAAPEQLRGEPAGVHTDVYSLGVILYELLTGRRPFDLSNVSLHEAERIVCEEEPAKPSDAAASARAVAGAAASAAAAGTAAAGAASAPRAIGKAAWADLDVLCLTAMHKDPQRRYASVEALIRDVDHFQRGEPLEMRGDSLSYRAGKFVRRHRAAVIAATLAIFVLTALVAFYTIRLSAARNAAVAEAARTQRIQRFMLDLFEGGEKESAPATDLRVVSLIDRGVKEARSLERDPLLQAEVHDTLGSLYQRLGSFDQADTLLRSALDARRAAYGIHTDHPEIAQSLIALGLLRVAQAKLEEGERFVREGLAMSERVLPAGDPLRAQATFALGKVLEERGLYKQAIPVLQDAAKMYPPATPEQAMALSELANSHFYAGELDPSEALNRQVIDINRRLHGERHPSVAHDLLNLAAIEGQRGKRDEEERDNREAVAILQAWYGHDHPETASALTILAQGLTAQHKYDEATELLREAAAVQERVHGPVHHRVAFVLNELGVLMFQRDKLDEAEAAFRRSLDIYREVYHGKHYRVAVEIANLASVYNARKEYARAEPLFREGIALYDEMLPPEHLNAGVTRIKLGHALVGLQRHAEAEPLLVRGYQIVKKQTTPTASWLQTARKDLIAVYAALGQPEKGEPFRAELASLKP
jgi:serine/threonine protein kinase